MVNPNDFPTPHLTLDEIESILYSGKSPSREQLINLALDAKNGQLYRKIIIDVFKTTECPLTAFISWNAIGEIIKNNVFMFVRRPGHAAEWTGSLPPSAPCGPFGPTSIKGEGHDLPIMALMSD